MKIIKTNPKKSLNKAFLKQRPLRSEMDVFKTNLITLLDKISVIEKRPKDEREEHLKNDLRDFLRDTYYKDSNAINTKDNKDLVIHLGKSTDCEVGVIIEAKRPTNKNEMITVDNPNKKALHELILYYLDERNKVGNNQLKQLVITNVNEWYIIDANYFDKHIYRNTQIKKLYETKINDKKDNPFFYEEISKIIAKIDIEIPCTYFDIREYKKVLRNKEKVDDKNLIALQKILSPFFLLKVPFANDSNLLNEIFYKELLHIIGLEEVKKGAKNIIRRKEKDKQPGSLIENAINILITEDSLHKINDKAVYGKTKDEQLFSIALELSLTWINRILFLKLLEGQLIAYHKGNKDYRFLSSEMINDFDELYKLFHQVLARNINERNQAIKQKYANVPYLNSSLFEISELEDLTVKINSLDNSETVELIHSTVLREEKRKNSNLPTLEYLFKFLDAYDFSSEGGEDIKEDNKTIINASVLGKVFEKINGYKEGSIFTPGFITMYMSRQSLRLAVIQKFNEYFKSKKITKVKTFEELYNCVDKIEIKTANEIVNSLRVCDPAVGSGHFLVSVLNELIVIKSELGILVDKNGKRLRDYEIVVDNDELVISDENGIFEYNYQNKESQRVQETIFNEQQTIIENCLFGVDINPNSVKICRLRLWIELLKSSYYKAPDFTELETLPNIDINIKCGNSLISRYSLDADLKKALQKSKKWNITSYRLAVMTYRNAKSKDEKREMEKLIDEIKSNFETEITKSGKDFSNWYNTKGKLESLTKQYSFFEMTLQQKKKFNQDVKDLTEKLKKHEAILEEVKNNIIYKNAFEWRFEFPEVLNNNGEFEGFDVVIGNPPYIESRSTVIDKKLKDEVLKNIKFRRKKDAELVTRGSDILIYFFELGLCLLKEKGYFSFITQNSWLDTDYGFKFQKFLKKNTEILGVFDNDIKYFDESANINTIITLFKGNSGNEKNIINFVRFNVGFEEAPYEPEKISSIKKIGTVIKVKQSDEMLDKIKWGIILNSDELIIDLHKRLFESKYKINFNYRIGQGLNLTKDYIASKEIIEGIKLSEKSIVPFFTNNDGAPFCINKTKNYLIVNSSLSAKQTDTLNKKGVKVAELSNSTRQIPSLILPRGIGRYFCAINNCNAYSSSFVEIYLKEEKDVELYKKYLWLFLNSSIGWLIREISGRKNLGGGMLKAEAIDLKNYPLLFDFQSDLPTIKKLFNNLTKRQSENSLIELNSIKHKEIDNLVFSKFGYNQSDKKKIVEKLDNLINLRVNKSKSKI